jgi:hypothetical protein
MARGFLRFPYRTYNFLAKNPVIDKARTILQDEGMFSKEKRKILHEISGVSISTFDGWFEGDTINPRHETMMATLSSVGYEEQFVKVKTIDVEAERKVAAAWFERQEKISHRRQEAQKAAKTNGHRKPVGAPKRRWTGKRWETK